MELNIFGFTVERTLAVQLSEYLIRKIPAGSIRDGTNSKLTEKKVSRALEEVFQQAVRNFGDCHVGIIRRSVLANNLKWRLKDAGYADDFVDLTVEGLVLELAKNKRSLR